LIKFLGELRLDSDGLTQSGSVMVWIWSQGINHLLPKDYRPESILVLGLGGGSALFWLKKHFPKAALTAVEIDPVMIDIAKRFFKIDKIKNLEIINSDAVKFIKGTKRKFSLIIVDCYRGFATPPEFEDIRVLQKMKKTGETVLINRLYWDQHKIAADEFVAKLSPHFRIKSVYTASNLVISLI
jgi:spermidine synthase